MHNLYIDSISSNLLYSKDRVAAFHLVSVDGTLLLLSFCVQYKVLANWARACQLLFRLCSQRLFLGPCRLDRTTVGGLSCCNKPLLFANKRLVGQLWPHAPHPPSLSALQDFFNWLLILTLLS